MVQCVTILSIVQFKVVLAMRDLFQVVFELKKKEIELARQHIQSKTIHEHQPVTLSVKSSILDSSSPPSHKSSREPSTSKVSHKEVIFRKQIFPKTTQ